MLLSVLCVTLSYQCLNRINAIDFRAGRAVTMTVTNCAPYASDVACSIFSADHLLRCDLEQTRSLPGIGVAIEIWLGVTALF